MMVRRILSAAALVATFAASATAAPIYAPSGPQTNVLLSTVTGGGWTMCFSGAYGVNNSVASALSGCTGDLLMMAGGENDSNTLELLAWAPKADVLTVTGTNAVTNSNDTNWYFNSLSWGFAPEGFAISQNSCDTNSAPGFGSVGDDGTQRLCWHTSGNAGGGVPANINGGWRVGNETFLNSEPSGHTRYLFTANVPEPATGALLLLGAAAVARRVRRRAAAK